MRPKKAPSKSKTVIMKSKVKVGGRSHPTYSAMIITAISELKDRKGSSRPAIKNFVVTNYKIDEKVATSHLRVAIRKGLEKGELIQVKGCFKLPPPVRNKKPAAPKKNASSASKKSSKVVKKTTNAAAKKSKEIKKSPAKKKLVGKKTPKKPDSKK